MKGLLDVQKQIQDLYDENRVLQVKIKELEAALELHEKVVRHLNTYITLKDDSSNIIYCATCWDNARKLVQLSCDNGRYSCNNCKNIGFYNKELYDKHQSEFIKKLYGDNTLSF